MTPWERKLVECGYCPECRYDAHPGLCIEDPESEVEDP